MGGGFVRLKLTREQRVAHRFLSSFNVVGDRMKSSIGCLERAESARNSISASIEAFSISGSQSDKMLDALVRMDEAIEDIRGLSGSFASQFQEVESYVSAVQRMDAPAGKVLRMVYIDGMTAKEAAQVDECAKKTVYANLKRGLDLTFALLA